jgi:hypothetical protein
VFENRVLRRIFGPKCNEVTGRWRKLHNEELHNLYFSPNDTGMTKSRRMRWAGNVVHMGEMRNAYKILIGKPEGPLGRPRHIKMYLREMGLEGVDLIHLVGSCEHGNEPSGSIKDREFFD